MTEREINIGKHARSSDGKDLGQIESLIVNTDTGQVLGFVLDRRLFKESKIVDIAMIAATDHEGIRLSVTSAESDDLPAVVAKELLRAPDTLTYSTGFGGMTDIKGTGNQWLVMGSGGGLPSTGGSSLFMQAPIGTIEARVISTLPDDAVLISEGTDVIGADGKKMGQIDEIYVNEVNHVTAIVVKQGFLFKKDVSIPVSHIASATHKHVWLKVNTHELDPGE